jgi:actin-related protein
MSENKNIVIDNGSGVIKAGFSGDNQPSVKFPSIVGVPRSDKQMVGVESKSEYIGDEAQKMRGVLNLKYPIESGIISEWDLMEKVWDYCFSNELRVDPTEHKVMLTEAPNNPKTNREKMTQLMFETFQVQGLYVAIQAVLSLYSNGRTTGMVVDSGDGVTHTIPVFEGFSIPHAVKKNFIAGRAITSHMVNLLNAESISDSNAGQSAWLQIVGKIKEETAYVTLDFEAEKAKAAESSACQKSYQLPDGQMITVNSARFCAPEALFNPGLIKEGDEVLGMHSMGHATIQECDVDIRKDLYQNIILSGGTTLYEGLPDRLEKEIDALCPQQNMVKIIASKDRYYSVWTGGSTLSSLSTFESQWITKDEYEENGAEIVHRKCV